MANSRKSAAQRLVQARTGRDLADHLRELYVAQRLTDQEIADQLDVARSTVRGWRNQLGIDRSERKAALA
jgi:DNA-binding CsgD family transcriptional regulator